MNKIMILGAGTYQVPLIKKARERGLYTVVVSPDGDYPGLAMADKVYYYDVRDEKAVLEAAREEKISGVITDQTDIAVRTVAYVAENMGLPGIGHECARLFTDKILMREKSAELGLPTIKFARTFSLDEAKAFFDAINVKAIIKPADNQGSRGVFKIDSMESLVSLYDKSRQFSKTGEVIIEQYIEGTEFEVDSIVLDYESRTLMYADLSPFDEAGIFASTTRLYPSVEDKAVVDKLLKLNKYTIEGFGLKQGVTHSEYIMDEDGEIYLIEAAARGGGTFISSDISKLQTGVDVSDFLISMALGEINEMPEFSLNQCSCGYVTFYLPEGKVVSTDGVEEVKQLEYVKKHLLDDIYVGLETEDFTDKTARYAVILMADTREELEERIDNVRHMLDIKVETDSGIRGPVWK